jgi:hypothetical protein
VVGKHPCDRERSQDDQQYGHSPLLPRPSIHGGLGGGNESRM